MANGLEAFELATTPALSRSALERAAELRTNAAVLATGWHDSAVLTLNRANEAPGTPAGLQLIRGAEISAAPPRGAVLIAIDSSATVTGHVWALRRELPPGPVTTLRDAGSLLTPRDAGLFTTAQAVLNWHDTARFCPSCGARTQAISAGWARSCDGCGREDYPRTDPAVICLVHDGADRVLLARQPTWPEGRYSLLAGFVEAGESAEACVLREVAEEVGVAVEGIRYLGSQPWPFPRSLMLGYHAVADPAAPIVPEPGEIEDARWFHRAEVESAVAVNQGPAVGKRRFTAPGAVSIAHGILSAWVRTRHR
ncbi:NAD(+) diphosphatase [Hoyosella sp. YIM 151337]|uniref:NAD(+) diphosphatase n=1 Tax=Hoyosella sp. YIM 151337 TaxID=2992742 RepID=UPI0022357DBD|nr:NAD(+) diphosphatase [Hoyosella sp. YIM 151337]MCW4352259.1 NAD(+) diphosphatase [Hoyosella sp. YIM 151337]